MTATKREEQTVWICEFKDKDFIYAFKDENKHLIEFLEPQQVTAYIPKSRATAEIAELQKKAKVLEDALQNIINRIEATKKQQVFNWTLYKNNMIEIAQEALTAFEGVE